MELNQIELEIINHSLKFSKNDFVVGHLDYITKNFNINILRIVDNKLFLNYINKIKTSKKILNKVEKVDLNLIDKHLENTQPIVYIDSYSLYGGIHYPHFITILEKINNKYRIFDTWDGKTKIVTTATLSKAISSLKNHLKFCPQVIIIKK